MIKVVLNNIKLINVTSDTPYPWRVLNDTKLVNVTSDTPYPWRVTFCAFMSDRTPQVFITHRSTPDCTSASLASVLLLHGEEILCYPQYHTASKYVMKLPGY